MIIKNLCSRKYVLGRIHVKIATGIACSDFGRLPCKLRSGNHSVQK